MWRGRQYFKRALDDTWPFIGRPKAFIGASAAFLAGSSVFAYLNGFAAVMGEFWVWLSYSVGGVLATGAAIFICNLALAPYRVHRDRADEAEASNETLRQITAPRLTLKFDRAADIVTKGKRWNCYFTIENNSGVRITGISPRLFKIYTSEQTIELNQVLLLFNRDAPFDLRSGDSERASLAGNISGDVIQFHTRFSNPMNIEHCVVEIRILCNEGHYLAKFFSIDAEGGGAYRVAQLEDNWRPTTLRLVEQSGSPLLLGTAQKTQP